MKHFILLLFVLLPFCTFSQVNETFDGPEIASGWIGHRDSFKITADGRLQTAVKPSGNGSVSIGMNIMYASDMQWEFDVQMNGAPSDNNKLCVYLYREKNAYYYVRIGFNKKEGVDADLALRYTNEKGTLPQTEADLFPRNPNSYQKGTWVHVKVTLEDNNLWTLYSRQHDLPHYIKEGTVVHPVTPVEKGQFSFKFFYTPTLSGLFSIDNVCIQHHITSTNTGQVEPGEDPEEDTDGLVLSSLKQESANELLLTFDEPVVPGEYQIALSDLGEVDDVYISDDEQILKLVWDKAMRKSENYTLSYSGIYNKLGTECRGDTTFLSDYGEMQEGTDPVVRGTVRINEIMADPKGLVVLPETEYVELRNMTSSVISLNRWRFSYGGSEKRMGDVRLPANSFAVLYRSGRKVVVDAGGMAVPMDDFPAALANTGKTLQLSDAAGNLIDEVTYAKATPAKSWERSSAGEWVLSTDPRGGTPGSENSSPEQEKPDEPEDPEEPVDPDDPGEPETSSVQPGDIIINELLPEPYSGGSEYVELYNCSDKTFSLKGLSVALRKTDGTFSTHYPLTSIKQPIAPGGYALLTKSIEGISSFYLIASPLALHEIAKLPILANTASTLALFRSSDEVIIDEVAYSSKWHAPSVKEKKGVSLERISPSGKTQDPANWTSATEASGYGTPGYRNSQYETSSEGGSTGIEAPVYVEEGNMYKIRYNLDQSGYNARISIYNTAGIQMAEVANHELLALSGQLTWSGNRSDGRRLPPGVYIFYAELYHPQGKVVRYKKPFLVH